VNNIEQSQGLSPPFSFIFVIVSENHIFLLSVTRGTSFPPETEGLFFVSVYYSPWISWTSLCYVTGLNSMAYIKKSKKIIKINVFLLPVVILFCRVDMWKQQSITSKSCHRHVSPPKIFIKKLSEFFFCFRSLLTAFRQQIQWHDALVSTPPRLVSFRSFSSQLLPTFVHEEDDCVASRTFVNVYNEKNAVSKI